MLMIVGQIKENVMKARYTYQMGDRVVYLVPEYTHKPNGSIRVIGCGITRKDGYYLGYWYRENMPVNLVVDMQRYVQEWLASIPKRKVPLG